MTSTHSIYVRTSYAMHSYPGLAVLVICADRGIARHGVCGWVLEELTSISLSFFWAKKAALAYLNMGSCICTCTIMRRVARD